MSRLRRGMCLGCHQPKPIVRRGRCADCTRAKDAAENTERRKVYTPEWRKISRRALARHRMEFGDWCPVCQTHTTDLTVDHVKPRSMEQGVRVMCRACNSRKGNR